MIFKFYLIIIANSNKSKLMVTIVIMIVMALKTMKLLIVYTPLFTYGQHNTIVLVILLENIPLFG